MKYPCDVNNLPLEGKKIQYNKIIQKIDIFWSQVIFSWLTSQPHYHKPIMLLCERYISFVYFFTFWYRLFICFTLWYRLFIFLLQNVRVLFNWIGMSHSDSVRWKKPGKIRVKCECLAHFFSVCTPYILRHSFAQLYCSSAVVGFKIYSFQRSGSKHSANNIMNKCY